MDLEPEFDLVAGRLARDAARHKLRHDRAQLRHRGFVFEPFSVVARPVRLAELELDDDDELIIIERGGIERGFLARELTYHHVAQGELAGHRYALHFCVISSAAIGLTPVLDGALLELGASGMSNGMSVVADTQTGSHWELMTGEAFTGPLRGRKLETWPVRMTSVGAARIERPQLRISRSGVSSIQARMVQNRWPRAIDEDAALPSFAYASMTGGLDPRLPLATLGLAVLSDDERPVFYPMSAISSDDELVGVVGRRVVLLRRGRDGLPRARWADRRGLEPRQLLTRWYAFSLTFPGCEIGC